MLVWYNYPFFALIATAFLFLGLQFLGGDHDSDLDIDSDLNLEINTHLDIDGDLDADMDADLNAAHDLSHDGDFPSLIGFINIGRVPLSLLLMSLCFAWGAFGLFMNLLLKLLLAGYPNWGIVPALVLSGIFAVLSTRLSSRTLGALFRENSSASQPDDLIGCVGTVISGSVPEAGQSGFGRARVYNAQGVLLQVACVTQEGALPPHKKSPIFVTGYDEKSRLYSVLTYDSPDFQAYFKGNQGEMRRFEDRLRQSREHQLQDQSERN